MRNAYRVFLAREVTVSSVEHSDTVDLMGLCFVAMLNQVIQSESHVELQYVAIRVSKVHFGRSSFFSNMYPYNHDVINRSPKFASILLSYTNLRFTIQHLDL